MSMFLFSKQLLEEKIAETEQRVDLDSKMLQSCFERELRVIEKLDIAFCDMTGILEDVEKRLDGCEVLIMPKGTYNEMANAVYFKDCVKKHLEDIENESSRETQISESRTEESD